MRNRSGRIAVLSAHPRCVTCGDAATRFLVHVRRRLWLDVELDALSGTVHLRGAGVLTIDDAADEPRLVCGACYAEMPLPAGWSIRSEESGVWPVRGEAGSRGTEAGGWIP